MKFVRLVTTVTEPVLLCLRRTGYICGHAKGIEDAVEAIRKNRKKKRISWPGYTFIPGEIVHDLIVSRLPEEEKSNPDSIDWEEAAQMFVGEAGWIRDPLEITILKVTAERIRTREIPLYIEPARIKKFLIRPYFIRFEDGMDTSRGEAVGFFTWLDYSPTKQETYLRFEILFDDYTELHSLPLREGTLVEECQKQSKIKERNESFEYISPLFKTLLWIIEIHLNPKARETEEAFLEEMIRANRSEEEKAEEKKQADRAAFIEGRKKRRKPGAPVFINFGKDAKWP